MLLRSVLAFTCIVGILAPSGASASRQWAASGAPHLYRVNVGLQLVGAIGAINVEVNKFFPDKLTIHAGDRIQFVNVNSSQPQTVTFGPLLNTPALFPKKTRPEVNPLVSKPQGGTIVTDPSTYIYSSGVLMSGMPGVKTSYTFSFPQVGTYSYRSLFHPDGLGQVVVVPPGGPASSDPPDQSASLYDALRSLMQALPLAQVATRNGSTALGGGEVQVGAGNNNISIQSFFSPGVTTSIGSTITWAIHETSGDPHVIVFNRPTQAESTNKVQLYTGLAADGGLLVNPAYWAPTLPSGTTVITSTVQQLPSQRWTSGLLYGGGVNSPSALPTQYSLTFKAPGTYDFLDPFHPGMSGVVVVLPISS